jgi:patatin-like phospholipase/acyl hydrolase
MAYNILSLDGGGVCGTATVAILKRIIDKYPNFLNKIDLIAGTSVGGIIALLLGSGKKIEDIYVEFPEMCKEVFKSSLWRKLLFYTGFGSKYSNEALQDILSHNFGDLALSDLTKKVVIPIFNMNDGDGKWCAEIVHNFPRKNSRYDGWLAVDAAMGTSAAPIMFPMYRNFIDGVFVENNPALCAVCATQDKKNHIKDRPALNHINVLAIGRETQGRYLDMENVDWGYFKWANLLIRIVLDRDTRVVDYQLAQLLNERYCRVKPVLDVNTVIDNVASIDEIVKCANEASLDETFAWIEKNMA